MDKLNREGLPLGERSAAQQERRCSGRDDGADYAIKAKVEDSLGDDTHIFSVDTWDGRRCVQGSGKILPVVRWQLMSRHSALHAPGVS